MIQLLRRLGWITGALLSIGFTVHALDEVPCLVFSGAADSEKRVDLSEYNRICFGDESMTMTSATNADKQPIELSYSLFHHLEIADAVPSEDEPDEPDNPNVDVISIPDALMQLLFAANEKTLSIEYGKASDFTVVIFNAQGQLVVSKAVSTGEPINLSHLSAGVYVAKANGTDKQQTLKFVLK